eukprot:1600271-Pyramimonas_sp.AAC.1
MLAEAKEHLLRLPGEEGPIAESALRHRALRTPAAVPRSLAFKGRRGLELGSPLGTYGRAWEQLGGELTTGSSTEVDWITCTLPLDPKGFEVEKLVSAVARARPQIAVVDAPGKLDLARV